MQKIGFIGLGIMGRPMAKNLIKAGYELKVFDLNKEAVADVAAAGATACASIAETCVGSDVIITMVPNSPQVKAGDKRRVTLTFTSALRNVVPRMLYIKLITSDNLTVDEYEKTLALEYAQPIHGVLGVSKTSFEVTVGENLKAVDRLYAEITSSTLPYPVMIPVVFLGR